jgi:hypothetical protein
VRKLRLLTVAVGGVPAVVLVSHFVPQPADEFWAGLWIVVLWVIGWAVSELLYRLLSASRGR